MAYFVFQLCGKIMQQFGIFASEQQEVALVISLRVTLIKISRNFGSLLKNPMKILEILTNIWQKIGP